MASKPTAKTMIGPSVAAATKWDPMFNRIFATPSEWTQVTLLATIGLGGAAWIGFHPDDRRVFLPQGVPTTFVLPPGVELWLGAVTANSVSIILATDYPPPT